MTTMIADPAHAQAVLIAPIPGDRALAPMTAGAATVATTGAGATTVRIALIVGGATLNLSTTSR